MQDETTKPEDMIRDAASEAGMEESTVDKVVSESKSFLDRAQKTLSGAVDTTVGAVKEHPITAAGIAAGAAAAVAGAAYGATRLVNGASDSPGGAKKKKKS